MNLRFFTALFLFFYSSHIYCQVGYSANEQVFQYQGQFRGGYNSGFAAGWSDLSIATLAAGDPTKYVIGVGLKSNRDALFFEALETQGYASKMEEVWHYDSLGLQDLTALIIGGEGGAAPEPPAPYRDTAHYCPTKQSTLFANLYTDIWDGGANGTPYNDENYFAAYMYKTVDQYKDFITFWEIWNEPGFDFSGNHGWRKPGDPEGNWWDEDPDPCDYKLGAPVQHYVRTLRIAWEIIKTLDPNSFVCMGAPGFPSFVDAVARNTDNPVDGSVTADYPLKGGAYFDAMCYHSFPHFDDSFVTSEVPFKIERNSDVAANSVIRLKDSFEGVLENYGYDGSTYPRKQFLITEINLPRKIFDYNIKTYGGEIAQRNFMMKAFMNCKIANIWQMHVYTFGELKSEADAVFEFELMGLYKNMDNTNYFTAQPTGAGVGIRTTAPLLWDTDHDPARSALLTNDDVRVEAFKRADGTYVYALWAIMKSDFNEFGTAYYNFPTGIGIPDFMRKYEWKHSITGEKFVTNSQNITVDGTPVFIVEEDLTGEALPHFTVSPLEGCIPYQITYTNASQNADSVRWNFQNGTPQFTTDPNPTITYTTEGYQTVTLTAYNGLDSNVNRQDYYMHSRDEPVPGFIATLNFGNAFFLNTTFDGDSWHWDFGDGGMSTDEYPAHTYAKNGKYEVTLTATNPCGTVVYKDSVEVLYALEVDFLVAQNQGCRPHTVQYQANSPLATEYKWFFPGGNPDTSSIATPVVTYDTAGIYAVSLSVANGASGGTITKDSFIVILDQPEAGFTHSINGLSLSLVDTSIGTNTALLWDFGDGNNSSVASPNHTYASQGVYDVSLVIGGPCGADTATTQVTVWEMPVANFTSNVQSGCAPLTVDFSNTGSDGVGNTYNWAFSGGTPAQSSDQNPTVVFNVPGIYDVSFTISNPAGTDTKTIVQSIEVFDHPSASFSSSTDGLDVSFTEQSSASTTYYWDFGDGNTSSDQNPMHSYSSQGVYDVFFVSSSVCGMDTAFASVSAYEVPVANFSSSVNEGCAPLEVSFTNIGSSGVGNVYEWDFASGVPSVSNNENPTVVFSSPGLFDVTFTISNPAGTDTKALTQTIEVNAPTQADFSNSVQYLTVDFSNLSSNADDYLWHFGNGISSMLENPSYTFDTSGVHTITLISYNSCSTDTIIYDITTFPVPPNAYFSTTDTVGCGPLDVQFFNESVGVVDSFLWNFPNGNPSSSVEENPIVTYSQSGVYTASLIVKNISGTDTLTFSNIEVLQETSADIQYQQQSYSLCFNPGTSVNYDSLFWNINGTNTSTDLMPCVAFTTDTSLQIPVTLVAYGACGNDTLHQIADLLISKPIAAFTTDTTAGCVPIDIDFIANQTNLDTITWYFEGGNPISSTDVNPTVSYTQGGFYSVMQIVENEFGIDTLIEQNYINAEPSPFTFFGFAINSDTVTFQNQSTPNNNTYLWDFGNGMTSTLSDPEIIFLPGTYTVTLTAQNPCGTEVYEQQVTILTNTSTLPDGTTVGLYPNPTTTDIWFVFEGAFNAQTIDIQIFNEIGQLVLTKDNHAVYEQVSLLGLPSGMYTIQLKTEKGDQAVLRVIKE